MEQYLRDAQAGDDLRSETLRGLGGLVFGLGMLAVLTRKSGGVDPWGDFLLFAVVLIPAVVLYGGGLMAARVAPAPRPWHAVWITAGIFLIYGTTQQFLALIDGNQEAPLNAVWTFGLIAAAGVAAALWAAVRVGWLIAALALTLSWLALWDQLISDGLGSDIGTFRGLCMIAAAALLAGAFLAVRRDLLKPRDGADVLTAAGVVFVVGAGAVSVASLFAGLFIGAAAPTGATMLAEPSLFWDTVLLIGSLALVAVGTQVARRGPVYVGVVGLAFFITIIGAGVDIDESDSSLVGWPLVLLILGVGAVAASIYAKASLPGQKLGENAPPE